MRKLVSVVTGTYNRPRLVSKCIQEVRKQTYPNIEHCIVSDGPDELLRAWANNGWTQIEGDAYKVPIKFAETGRQWSHFLANSISAVPYQVAQWLASGDYLMWLADDEEITEDHIESLVDLLETEDVDFVYSKTNIWFNPETGRVGENTIGVYPPINGQLTEALYRVELLDYAGFEPHVGSGTDWHQIQTWLDYGASCAFLDRVTHTHRVDKMGDVNARRTRQPLRGREKCP